MKNKALIALTLPLFLHCSSQNDGKDIVYSELPDASSENGLWHSNPWDEGWLDFPGQSTVELFHDQDQTPVFILPYISFHDDGASNALASGDLARIIDVNESTITLKNNTNEDFFLRVVLQF